MTDLDPGSLASLVTFALVATLSPGGPTTLATASGASVGFARSVPLLAGISLGLASLVAAVAGGVGTMLSQWPIIDTSLRIVGSLYLLFLAWKVARASPPSRQAAGANAPSGFGLGVLLLWLNPKAWTMAVASTAAYAGLSDSPWLLAALLGSIFAVCATLSVTLWCVGGSWLAGRLRTPGQWRVLNLSLALLLALFVLAPWR